MVRLDLIDKEMEFQELKNYFSRPLNISYINYLFKNYNVKHACLCWYDGYEGWSEEQRLNKCIWYDPYGEGIWNMDQNKVNKVTKDFMLEYRRTSISKQNRFWCAHKDNEIWCYWYSRDYHPYSCCWWIFVPK